MWGKHLIIDMSSGDLAAIRSPAAIAEFATRLVEAIDMKAYGPPIIQHFAEHLPEAAGYSLVQLIETSAITGHFCDLTGDAYIDIFSCKDFDSDTAVAVLNETFRPEHVNVIGLARQARRRPPMQAIAAE